MRVGDVVLTSSITACTSTARHTTQTGFKANNGHKLVFLYLGTVSSDEEIAGRAEKVLRAGGWERSAEQADQSKDVEARG